MNHLVFMVSYENEASAPEGSPPCFGVRARSDEVTVLEGDAGAVPAWVTYETHVQMTGETTLDEHGTMTLGGEADRLTVATIADGMFLPTPADGVMQGMVMWRVTDGFGRFAGASGVITGNFTHSVAANRGREFQIVNLFLA
jgi:hypothetical protein